MSSYSPSNSSKNSEFTYSLLRRLLPTLTYTLFFLEVMLLCNKLYIYGDTLLPVPED